MRVTTFVVFLRLIGAAGVGAYVGAAAAGLIVVLTGRVFSPAGTWVTALPVLAVFGALLTAGVARLTRFWLLPRVTGHRVLLGAAAGAVLAPLTVAVGQPGALFNVALLLMLIGAVATAVPWARWFRATHSTSRARPRMYTEPQQQRSLSRKH
ncbi:MULTISPECIES: hypothetical protein [Actinosynnema]|uniref:hypothetical protein n=1 Tax=Actinosynnema TaxID=40566 RepID=UPI0020A602E5|nr:hypothetical protein [Actinosynnema pretiosum]MCP2097496.1 hypothetical protein [Actinosynnema pretiosum]